MKLIIILMWHKFKKSTDQYWFVIWGLVNTEAKDTAKVQSQPVFLQHDHHHHQVAGSGRRQGTGSSRCNMFPKQD